ncbi:MAG: peptidoglycan-binding domain-containing protein [Clostridium sp.]
MKKKFITSVLLMTMTITSLFSVIASADEVTPPNIGNTSIEARASGDCSVNGYFFNIYTDYVGYNKANKYDAVMAAQILLSDVCYNIGKDGIFGSETHAAILYFQDKYNLSCDGIIGPATWRALLDAAD